MLASSHHIVLRPAMPEDRDMIFSWRNDSWIVSLSAGQRRVTREEHGHWFARILQDPAALLFIVVHAGTEIGTVRVEMVGRTRAALTVYLLQPYTGKGLGTEAIRQGSESAFKSWPQLETIHALIRADNEPSIAAFRKAGYSACPREAATQTDSRFMEMYLVREGAR